MLPTITFFPVDNGDMTLIKLNDTTTMKKAVHMWMHFS
jgi:hypothetical protein